MKFLYSFKSATYRGLLYFIAKDGSIWATDSLNTPPWRTRWAFYSEKDKILDYGLRAYDFKKLKPKIEVYYE